MEKTKILVVDNEPDIRKACTIALKKEGHEVNQAETGAQAVQMMTKENYDIVFLDIQLPDISGIETLKRSKPHCPQTDFVIMTAYPTVKNAIEALRLGAYDYITKPFSIDELILLTQRCLNQQRLKNRNIDLESQLKNQLKSSEENVIEKTKELTALYTISFTVIAGLDIIDVLRIAAREISKLIGTDRSTIYLVEKDKLVSWLAEGVDSRIETKLTEGVAGWVATTGKAYCTNDAYNDRHFTRNFDEKTGYRTKNLLTVPIIFKAKVIGVLQLLNKEAGFIKEDITKLTHLAEQISIVIQRAKLEKQVKNQNQELEKMLDGLSKQFE